MTLPKKRILSPPLKQMMGVEEKSGSRLKILSHKGVDLACSIEDWSGSRVLGPIESPLIESQCLQRFLERNMLGERGVGKIVSHLPLWNMCYWVGVDS